MAALNCKQEHEEHFCLQASQPMRRRELMFNRLCKGTIYFHKEGYG
jgi:hypothetical protein